jgi:hypothetical protein
MLVAKHFVLVNWMESIMLVILEFANKYKEQLNFEYYLIVFVVERLNLLFVKNQKNPSILLFNPFY